MLKWFLNQSQKTWWDADVTNPYQRVNSLSARRDLLCSSLTAFHHLRTFHSHQLNQTFSSLTTSHKCCERRERRLSGDAGTVRSPFQNFPQSTSGPDGAVA